MKKSSILFLSALLSTGLLADDVPESVKICLDCHGENGVSQNTDVPTIAGQPSVFLEETLFAFHDGRRPVVTSKFRYGDVTRPATDMGTIAKKLDYHKIIEIADYFANQTFVPAQQAFDAQLVETGAKLHFNLCEDCHHKGGREPVSNSARLAGQWIPYLDSAMKILRSGKRETDQDMKDAIAKLSDADWMALKAYYASQQN